MTFLITREQEDGEAWSAELEGLGARSVQLPCIRCELLHDPATLQRLREAMRRATWLVLTSRRGVRAVASLLPSGLPEGLRLAAVGERSAAEARRLLGRCDLTGDGRGAASLAGLLLDQVGESDRVVVAAADRAGHDLEDRLEPRGVAVDRVAVYRTVPAPAPDRKLDLAELRVDAILLASPSAVDGLLRQAIVPPHLPVLTVGPSTTRAARAAGLTVSGEARRPDLEGLLEAMP